MISLVNTIGLGLTYIHKGCILDFIGEIRGQKRYSAVTSINNVIVQAWNTPVVPLHVFAPASSYGSVI